MGDGHLKGGRYRLLDRLGAGGMSVVWRGYDDVLDRDVAIKVLSVEAGSSSEVMDRIRMEARAAGRLRHPNVVEVHDYGEATDATGARTPYVVMELIDGRSLDQLLTGGALPWRLSVVIGAQVAAALAAAHAQGIVHRDIKPGNVMVTAAGVKLVDFGISAAVGDADGADGGLFGTPAYLAPERIDGGRVRPATDVYALGLLLHRMLAGQLPWQASTVTEMLRAHQYQEPGELPAVTDLPHEVRDLCRRCLAKDPGERPAASTAARILAEAAGLGPASLLIAGVESGDASASTAIHEYAPTVVTAAGLSGRRRLPAGRRARIAAAATAGLILVGTLVGWATADREDQDAGPSAASPAVSTSAAPSVMCTVDYSVRSAANGRASTAVTVSNTGSTPLKDWRLSFALPADQRLAHGWSGRWQQTGQSVQAQGADLPAHGSVTTGFDAVYHGVNSVPTRFELDGTACTSVLSVAGQRSPAASPSATSSAGEVDTTGKAKKKGHAKEKKSKDG